MFKKAWFSNWTRWESSLNRIAVITERLQEEGRPFVDLTVSNPTKVGFSYEDDFLTALTDQANRDYRPDPRGEEDVRHILAAHYQSQGCAVAPEDILLTAGTSQAYAFLMAVLSDPGEAWIFPQPSYPLFAFLADIGGVRSSFYLWSSPETIVWPSGSNGSDIKAVTVIHPHNPLGWRVEGSFREEVVDFCQKHQAALVSDEVFLDFVVDAKPARSLAGRPKGLTFVLGGVSKSLALPQMKLAWIVMSGEKDLKDEARRRLEIVSDTFLSVSSPVQKAFPVWWENKDLIQTQIRQRLTDNLTRLKTWVDGEMDGVCQLVSEPAGWNAVVKIPDHWDEEALVVKLLEDYGVAVYPGYFFDFEEGRHIVLSLLPQPNVMEKGLEALASLMRCS